MATEYPIVPFADGNAWREWLHKHHADTDGIWMRIYKKGSGLPTITYAEALDEALCFGWIDGQKKSLDDVSFLQKFTPRRPKSLWSKRNIEHIDRLTKAGLMMPTGLAEAERAKQDGRWDAAYDKPSEMVVPASFVAELRKHPEAEAFFKTLNKTNTYAIAWRLQTAKTEETRKRRQDKLIAMLTAGQKLH
jgi:uncharacterized protein YdeI (YjbR/CyaY-like superfamily)